MVRSLQRCKTCERCLTLLVTAALVLALLPVPAGASAPAAAQAVQLQDGVPVPEPVSPPEPGPQWPEVGERVQYTPEAEPLSAPQTLAPAPAASPMTSMAVPRL